eukprot:6333102-Prymnesium_polylepis.1
MHTVPHAIVYVLRQHIMPAHIGARLQAVRAHARPPARAPSAHGVRVLSIRLRRTLARHDMGSGRYVDRNGRKELTEVHNTGRNASTRSGLALAQGQGSSSRPMPKCERHVEYRLVAHRQPLTLGSMIG